MTRKLTCTRSRWAASIMVMALVVAACGDDDDDDAATEDTGDTTETTAAAPATTSAATEAPTTTEAAPGTTAAPEATEAPVATEAPEPQTIQIGFAWPDLSAFVQVSEAYGVGDPEQQMLAVIEGWRQDGTLPINGVDIELVSQSFDSLDSETKLAACQKFGTEGEIFAVLGGRIFTDGAECLATRFQIPVIDTDQAPAATMAAAAPYMFTLKPDTTEAVTAFANWGLGRGSFEGKNVGIYWEGGQNEAVEALRQLLTDGGVTIASEVESGGPGSVGSEQDALAAQRFQADGVDMVVFLVGSSSMVNFLQTAADQGYTPDYLDFEWSSHMSDVASGAYNQEQWAGTEALSATTVGELPDLNAESEACIANYEAFSGTTIDRNPPEKSGEFSNILIACELGNILLEGIRGATADGAELTREAFIAAVEAIDGLPGRWIDTVSFSADDHTAPGTMREVVWDETCPCWKANSDWMPTSEFL